MNLPPGQVRLPYPGLRPFEMEDQRIFFGRELQVGAMLRQLEDHRFVAVVGSSGSGKSSLVRAGLLPAIYEGFLMGSTSWLILIVKPGHQPYWRLGCKLQRGIRPEENPWAIQPTARVEIGEAELVQTLRRSDRGLLAAAAAVGVPPETNIMLVVDQFEELFAFRRRSTQTEGVASRDESAAFVRMLLRSAADPNGPVWVLLTMRSDFIGDCETFLGLPEAVSHSQFLVPRLDRRQMEEVIRRPGEVKGAAFEPFTFAPGLVNRIINEAGDRLDQLPLLQHALMRTWKLARQRAGSNAAQVELTHADYDKAGGIERALSLHAEAAWTTLANDPRKALIVRRLFLLLCDISPDGQITRRRPKIPEVLEVTESDLAEIERVVRLFQDDDRNFLLPPKEEALSLDTYLDVSHEALLRQWRRFARGWLMQEQRDVDELRTLAKQSRDWVDGKGGLLGAQSLKRIADWQKRVSPKWALRYVDQEEWQILIRFLHESQVEVEREEREAADQAAVRRHLLETVGLLLLSIAVVSSVLGLMAHRAAQRERAEASTAQKAKETAEHALTRNFLAIVGTSADWLPSADELEALWGLAELDPANQKVRRDVVSAWLTGRSLLARALAHGSRGLHAAVGLNPALRTYFDGKAAIAARAIGHVLEHPEQVDTSSLAHLGDALAVLAGRLNRSEAAAAATSAGLALVKELADPQEIDSSRLATLSKTLAGLVPRIQSTNIVPMVQRLVQALENQQESDVVRLGTIGDALASLAAQAGAAELAPLAQRLAKALEATPEQDSSRTAAISGALATFAPRLSDSDAAAVLKRTGPTLVRKLEDAAERDPSQVPNLSATLGILMKRAEPGTVFELAERGASALARALEQAPEIESSRIAALAEGLAPLAGQMNRTNAAPLTRGGAAVLTRALAVARQKQSFGLSTLSESLSALLGGMEPAQAAAAAAQGASILIKALEDPQPTDSDHLAGAAIGLSILAKQMNPAEGAAVAARGAAILAKTLSEDLEKDSFQLARLSAALVALAGKLDPKAAALLAERLNQALQDLPDASFERLPSLCGPLHVLAQRMEAGEVFPLAERLVTVLEKSSRKDSPGVAALGTTLAACTGRLNSSQGSALAARGALVLARTLEDPSQNEPARLWAIGGALAALTAQLPKAEQAQKAALSLLFLGPIPASLSGGGTTGQTMDVSARICSFRTVPELAEMLKWPVCVGEARGTVLSELEKKTRRQYGGDLDQFIAQADSLGTAGLNRAALERPAKRPNLQDAISELQNVR